MLRLQRRARVPPAHLRRLQHTAAAATATSASSTSSTSSSSTGADSSNGGSGEEPPKYKPGWFSRNPGVTLGGILLGSGCYIYRGSRGKKNFEALQTPIAEAAMISPYEAWELRSSNNITPETFEDVRGGVARAFPSGKASMQHFDQYLGFKLAQACPAGVSKAYHLERVLLSLEQDTDRKSDVDAQMVAFSMAVKGAVDERLRILFNLATNAPPGEALNAKSEDEKKEEADTREMTQEQLERLLHLLLETYQIPSEKRVLAVEGAKYPFQEYVAATPSDMLKAAVQAQVADKKITEEEARERQAYTFEAFSQIMRGKTVCLWGECFSNSKKKMKN
ncbi:hypothetical protein PHYSODRAFT_342977 [Phytophthora sojae]|uniref:Uncharacterized protein n=1 Tax=Phytophthora sojae (strain P6497) TaxID=1094619 RepID=G4ZIU7_PHYSP|nr:hypothetical protein PHYSODRAFT_332011 [Phytophthora sojae]XP_009539764.1 hypothetical protein PHYSODRAFT_342977 [Phytophthora sojae]EGZ04788.1 hypothetical protein PHYSODRAFT_342977 [Phytophthora sojae]EGZ18161.1 hypothetical protein PHYSODRAFT_332011 [Phytophthora sojae]|eukprot:XP_009527219.1 hypothetical protein PHYSODRAFT_332011 [Phytophthora sojae]